jgi:nucleoside-diphosphate-sugar epimerase
LEAERRAAHFSAVAGLPIVILRTSRFFPEEILTDQFHSGKSALSLANIKANELLGGRVSLEDVVSAHMQALCAPPVMGCSVVVLAAPTPFLRDESAALGTDAPSVILQHFPEAAEAYAKLGWSLPHHLPKVYVVDKALSQGWIPRWTFAALLRDINDTEGRGARGAY